MSIFIKYRLTTRLSLTFCLMSLVSTNTNSRYIIFSRSSEVCSPHSILSISQQRNLLLRGIDSRGKIREEECQIIYCRNGTSMIFGCCQNCGVMMIYVGLLIWRCDGGDIYLMQLQTKPRLYADVNKHMNESYYNYEAYEIEYGDIDQFEIITKIGKGKYSEVYTGISTNDDKTIVIKALKPVKKSKIKREIKILKALNGHPAIIQLKDVVRDPASKSISLVFDYLDNVDFRSLIPSLTDLEIRYYLLELLKALDYCHSKGIMHRDVKPQNIIVNPHKKILKLIDWGLAEFYHMGQDYNVRVASRYFKGPELLVDYNYYDYSLDIWSTGAMFASMIFKKEPFFMGDSNRDQLVKIAQVLGTDNLYKYVKKYHLKLDEEFLKLLGKIPAKPWSKFVKPDNQTFCSEDALDLLNRMLQYDHAERILPREAMEHRYFDPVRV